MALVLAGCSHPPADLLRIATGDSGDGLEPHRRILAIATERGLHCRLEPISGGDYYTRLLTQLASQDPPDLMQLGDDSVPQFVNRGSLQRLDEPATAYLPGLLQPGRWRGELYMRPKDYTTFAVYCNLKVFRRYGVPPPRPDWTLADFRRAAEGCTRKQECWGLVLPGVSASALELWAALFGGRLVGPEGRYTGYLDSPQTIAALQFWHDLYAVAPLPLELGTDNSGNFDFEQGRAAMFLSGRWYLPGLRHNPEVELAVLPLPRGAAQANILYWAGFGIATGSRHPQEARQLLDLYTGPQGSAIWKDWALPAVTSVAEHPADPFDRVFIEQLDHLVPRSYAYDPRWRTVGEGVVRRLLETTLLVDGVDLAAECRRAAAEADAP